MFSIVGQTVLVADGDPFNLGLLERICEEEGYSVASAGDRGELLHAVARRRPDAIIMELALLANDGLQALDVIKGDPLLNSIPVIVATGEKDEEQRAVALRSGAHDFVSRPYKVFEVKHRIRAAMRMQAVQSEIAQLKPRTVDSVTTTALAHAGNAKELEISLDYEYTRAERYNHALTCLVVRVKNLRDIAQSSGDGVAEETLAKLAGGLRSCLREVDHVFRAGNDELAVLLPETGSDGAQVVRERVQDRISGTFFSNISPSPAVHLGLATFPDAQTSDANELLTSASTDLHQK